MERGMAVLQEREAAGITSPREFYYRLMKAMDTAGCFQEVLDLFEHMKEKGVAVSEYTYTTVIRACSQLKDAKQAQRYFRELNRTEGLQANQFTYCAVIDACVRSGLFSRGMSYMDEMKKAGLVPRHAVYGALISGCRFMTSDTQTAAKTCTALLRDMQEQKIRPNVAVYGAAMSVYYAAGDVGNVMALYKLMKHHGRLMDVGIYDALFKLFSDGAQDLSFVLQLYQEMQDDKILPSVYTFTLLMRCAMTAGDWMQAWAFYEDMKSAGLKPNLVIHNCIIGTYARAAKLQKHEPDVYRDCRLVVEVIEDVGLKPDEFTYNQLITLCRWLEDLDEGVRVFNEMEERGIEPTILSYTNLMKLHVDLGNPADGMLYLEPCFQILSAMERRHLVLDRYVFSSLFTACGRARNVDMVDSLLAKLQRSGIPLDRYLYNCIIDVWTCVDEVDRAMEMFELMQQRGIQPNVVTFTTLLKPLVEHSAVPQILNLIRTMHKMRVLPNEATRLVMQRLDTSNLRPPELRVVQAFLRTRS